MNLGPVTRVTTEDMRHANGWRSADTLGRWAEIQGPCVWDDRELRAAMLAPTYAHNTCIRRGCRVALPDDQELCDKHSNPADVPDHARRADDPTRWPKVRFRRR